MHPIQQLNCDTGSLGLSYLSRKISFLVQFNNAPNLLNLSSLAMIDQTSIVETIMNCLDQNYMGSWDCNQILIVGPTYVIFINNIKSIDYNQDQGTLINIFGINACIQFAWVIESPQEGLEAVNVFLPLLILVYERWSFLAIHGFILSIFSSQRSLKKPLHTTVLDVHVLSNIQVACAWLCFIRLFIGILIYQIIKILTASFLCPLI